MLTFFCALKHTFFQRSTRGYSFFLINSYTYMNICIYKIKQIHIYHNSIHSLRTSFNLTVFFACWKFFWVDACHVHKHQLIFEVALNPPLGDMIAIRTTHDSAEEIGYQNAIEFDSNGV